MKFDIRSLKQETDTEEHLNIHLSVVLKICSNFPNNDIKKDQMIIETKKVW